MAKEVVKYNSELNKLTFAGFNDQDLALFFAIAAKVKNKDDQEVTMDFSHLREICGETKHNESNREFAERAAEMHKKLLKLSFVYYTGTKIKGFNLFQSWDIDWEKETATVAVAPEFTDLFNNFVDMTSWTRFELEEFVSIRGKHPKNLYRLLKQWRTQGVYSETIKEFKRIMNAESYTNAELTRRVINPAVNKLNKITGFRDLTWHYSRKKNIPIRIVFEWTPLNPDLIKAEEELNEAIKTERMTDASGAEYDQTALKFPWDVDD